MNAYAMAVQELSLSGEIALGTCSKSTLYRWARNINRILEEGNCEFRVKANAATMTIQVQ